MKTPIENFITSIYAVTIPMLLFILAVSIKLSALFYSVFEIPVPELKLSASVLLAIAVSLTLLTVSVNSRLFETNSFPILFAICSGVMMLFVFKVIGTDILHWSEYIKRTFLSVFLATVEYVYSKLFVRKYQEEKSKEGLDPVKLNESLQQTKDRLTETTSRLQETEERLQETELRIKHARTHYYCQYCEEEFTKTGQVKTHEPKCLQNPRNK